MILLFVPHLHCLHALQLHSLSLVADTALLGVGVPSILPGIVLLELVALGIVGIGLADDGTVVALANCIPCPLHVRGCRLLLCLL